MALPSSTTLTQGANASGVTPWLVSGEYNGPIALNLATVRQDLERSSLNTFSGCPWNDRVGQSSTFRVSL